MKAYELLAGPKAWNQGRMARNAKGYPVDPESPKACSWCAVGAILRCYGLAAMSLPKIDILRAKTGNTLWWNDRPERTHAEVVAVLKELDI